MFHYITLHCITLHYTALQYITLHYVIFHHITLRTQCNEIDLRDFCMDETRLGHTRERREEIGAVLDDILQTLSVTAKQAELPRGRLHWFESFAFGRVANGAVKTLGNLSLKKSKKVHLSDHEVRDLQFLWERFFFRPTPSRLLSGRSTGLSLP